MSANEVKRMAELTAKQQRFVDEYCVDLNATQAAIRAGYTKETSHVQGPRLLGNVRVREAIEKKQRRLEVKTELTAEWVLKEFAENHKLAREVGELPASNKALEMIGKHLGMFKDKVELTGDEGGPLKVVFNIPRPHADD
jgi:phage terminase small subunit